MIETRIICDKCGNGYDYKLLTNFSVKFFDIIISARSAYDPYRTNDIVRDSDKLIRVTYCEDCYKNLKLKIPDISKKPEPQVTVFDELEEWIREVARNA